MAREMALLLPPTKVMECVQKSRERSRYKGDGHHRTKPNSVCGNSSHLVSLEARLDLNRQLQILNSKMARDQFNSTSFKYQIKAELE